MGDYTRKIASYSADFAFDKIPSSAVRAAKLVVLDTLGAILAASPKRYPAVKLVGDLARAIGGHPECTILGRDFKTSVVNAALVLGTMGYAADIEGAGIARMHAPAVFVPAGLAMGEREDVTGEDFIASLVLAYDVAARVSESARTTQHSYPHSFHPSAVFGTFGAAAVGGFDLELNAEEFVNAYGLAGLIASGLISWIYDPSENSRPFVIGTATQNGIMASMLAKLGFGGPQNVFDPATYNIYDAFSGEMHLDNLLQKLGEEFWIEKALQFKIYPCCGDIHSGIHGLLKIVKGNNLSPEDIQEIVHMVKEERKPIIDNNPLRSHNAQYMLAVAAVRRGIQWDDFLVDRRTDPTIRRIYESVKHLGSPELSNLPGAPAIVEVRTKGGKTFREKVTPSSDAIRHPGSASSKSLSLNVGDPITEKDLEDKFVKTSSPIIGLERAKEVAKAVHSLENLKSVRELVSLMQYE
jgi:2-methylcitrate dehydratase PrpD